MNQSELDRRIAAGRKRGLWAFLIILAGVFFFLFVPVLGIIIIAAGAVLFFYSRSRLKTEVGQAIAEKVLSAHLSHPGFDQSGGFQRELIDSLKLGLPGYDRVSCRDMISGGYRDREISACDMTLSERRTRSNGKTTSSYYETVFKGTFMSISYDREISCPVTVTGRSIFFSGDLVKTESEEFNRRFKVYCESEHEAFYIITPHMMERIQELEDSLGSDIYLNFCNDGNIYIAVDNRRDSFEIGLSDSRAEEIERRFESELSYLLMIADKLIAASE